MIFWIGIALLCILTVAVVAWPLLRANAANGLDSAQSRLAVMRDRQREIDREQAAGRLTGREADAARDELIESLADDLPAAESVGSGGSTPRRTLTAGFIAVSLPVLALLVYQQNGEPQIGAYPEMVSSSAPVTEDEIRRMVAQLVERTETNPDDGQAWLTLAIARRAMGDAAQAANAYGRAAALLPPDADLLTDQAEMTAISQGRNFAGTPEKLLRAALQIDPNSVKANALMGAAYMQTGRQTQALPHLKVLLASMEPGSADGQKIAQLVADLEQKTGGPGTEATAPLPSPATATANAALRGRIELTGEMPANAVLFISARAPTGSRMPYAAIRIPNPALPLDFALSDANAMSPQMKLSDAAEVVVEARLSLSGNAMRQPGDRFGTSEPLKPDAKTAITITIDQTVR